MNDPVLKSFLFGISTGDPTAWHSAPAALLAVAVAAAYLSARRPGHRVEVVKEIS